MIVLLIPFLGTTLGSAMVFFMKQEMNKRLEKLLLGCFYYINLIWLVWYIINLVTAAMTGLIFHIPHYRRFPQRTTATSCIPAIIITFLLSLRNRCV